ncbi:hypothetical protein JOB18_010811 [Solea senegalensis]|uniref:Uncharacterized protein n=1 Tax=Solea senegalensis TaxID=28829 RepID=A0AAV6PHL9_SOLSE|nr:hypothetical protein JOB18_010811 [Solea senegalensis]
MHVAQKQPSVPATLLPSFVPERFLRSETRAPKHADHCSSEVKRHNMTTDGLSPGDNNELICQINNTGLFPFNAS